MASPAVGLAVFGAGRIGALHARNVAKRVAGARLVGVADVDGAAAQRLVDELRSGRVDSVQALLSDPQVGGVVIATPTNTHAGFIDQAAAAGKHVLCEKPISLSLEATQKAIRSAQAANIVLQVGFQRRFDADFLHARGLVESGDLGEPRFLRLVGRDHRLPSLEYMRTSGGQFKDQMIHEFDAARWLLSPLEIDEIFATGSALVEPQIARFADVDTAIAVLRCKTGALAVIDDSREAAYGYDARAEIHGSKGMVLVGHQRLANGALMDAGFASPGVDSFMERFADAYRDEVEDFVRVIVERRPVRASAHDALEALRLAIAADRAFRARRPVKLSDVSSD